MNKKIKFVALLVVAGVADYVTTQEALAQTGSQETSQREQFVRLLLERQDASILQGLEQRKRGLEGSIQRVERLELKLPKGGRQLARAEQQGQRLLRQLRTVQAEIVHPPESALRKRMDQVLQSRQRELQQLQTKLKLLQGEVAKNPQQAQLIAQTEQSDLRRQRFIVAAEHQLERELATPFAPH